MDAYRNIMPRCFADASNRPPEQFFSLFHFSYQIKQAKKIKELGQGNPKGDSSRAQDKLGGETQVLAWSPILEDGFLCAHKRQSRL
jgi:hypothetical protein